MAKLFDESDIQGDATRLLSLPVFLDIRFRPGPKTQETLERFRDYPDPNEEPMAWAYRVYRFSAPKLKVVK